MRVFRSICDRSFDCDASVGISSEHFQGVEGGSTHVQRFRTYSISRHGSFRGITRHHTESFVVVQSACILVCIRAHVFSATYHFNHTHTQMNSGTYLRRSFRSLWLFWFLRTSLRLITTAPSGSCSSYKFRFRLRILDSVSSFWHERMHVVGYVV